MGRRSLILLTLNEIDGVRALIPNLDRSVADEILAVDGGSTDGTSEFLSTHSIRVCQQQKRGRGEAFRVGVQNCKGQYIVFFSPDGNEDPGDIPKLFEALESGADMSIASRFLPGAKNEEDDTFLPFRKWANQAFTIAVNLIWNRGRPWISDTINGFRGVRREAFNAISPSSMGYTIEYELTIGALQRGLKIVEIPTREGDRVGGETKAPSVKTGIIFLKFLGSMIVRDFRRN